MRRKHTVDTHSSVQPFIARAQSRALRLPWLALGALVGLAACHQPEPKCNVSRGDFAAKYSLVSGSGECAELIGEILSVQSYSAPRSGTGGQPDPNKTSVGIQPSSITDLLGGSAGLVEPNSDDKPYSLGKFDSAEPQGDDFCTVPTLSTARLRLPEIPEQIDECTETTTPAQPAVDVQYKFSNVRVFASPASYGTQLAADLEYTKDGCTATYRVVAVYPAVYCGAPVEVPEPEEPVPEPEPPEDGADVCGPMEPAPDPVEELPDDTLCGDGSGINPDLAAVCDPDLMLCVLGKEPPAWR